MIAQNASNTQLMGLKAQAFTFLTLLIEQARAIVAGENDQVWHEGNFPSE